MSKHANLPYHFYVKIDNKELGQGMPNGVTEGIWHGVYCRESQLILGHVMLSTGAHWSGVPLHAITTGDFSKSHQELMPWKGMGESIDAVFFNYLEGLETETRAGHGRHTGIIIDWKDGYSRYQQEHKPLNLVHLDSGQFALQPNNYCLFTDKHFTKHDPEIIKNYRRSENIFWE